MKKYNLKGVHSVISLIRNSLTEDNQTGAGYCWIDFNYYWEQIFFHHGNVRRIPRLISVFIFFSMFALAILYVVLFFYIRLQSTKFAHMTSSNDRASSHQLQTWHASVDASRRTHPVSKPKITRTVTVIAEDAPAPTRPWRSEEDRAHRRLNQASFKLLAYPLLYLCLTVPIGTVALASLAGHIWLTPVYVASCFFGSSGWANVILYTATRKGIISWNWIRPKTWASISDRRVGVPHHSLNVAPTTLSSKLSFSSTHPFVNSEQNPDWDSFPLPELAGNVLPGNTRKVEGNINREGDRTSIV